MLLSLAQGAVPKGNATKEFIESLQLKPGQVVYKCPKCCSIKPDRAHHCRYQEVLVDLAGPWSLFVSWHVSSALYLSVCVPDDDRPV